MQLYLLWYFHRRLFPFPFALFYLHRIRKKSFHSSFATVVHCALCECVCVLTLHFISSIEHQTIPRSCRYLALHTTTSCTKPRLVHIPRLAQSRSTRRQCQWTSNMIDGTSTEHLSSPADALNRIISTQPNNDTNDDLNESR